MRLKNTMKTIYSGLTLQMIKMVLVFISRTIFIKTLGSFYLGTIGLFTSIIAIFSLAELGVGEAILYNLYHAVSKNNEKRIAGLMKLYKKIYRVIFLIILISGSLFIPFLDTVIKIEDNLIEISLIYWLFVLNASISYLFIYRSSLIIANQKKFLLNRVETFYILIKNIMQIIILLITKNFFLYLIIEIILKLIQNIYISNLCLKLYPFLIENEEVSLSKKEEKKIFKDIKNMMIYKVGSVILNSSDNIIISKYLGIDTVGRYSNYLLVNNSLTTILKTIFNSMTSSVGNLVTTEKNSKKYEIFKLINFASFWIYGVCSICLFLLFNPFIKIWLGKEFLFSNSIVFIISLNFYIAGLLFPSLVYRQTEGLFKYGRLRPILSSFLNIIISLFLVGKIGLSGVLWGTAVTRLLTNVWYDPYIVFKYSFNLKVYKYLKDYFSYFILVALNFLINKIIFSKFLIIEDYKSFLINGILIFITSNIVFLIFTFKTNEFIYYKRKIMKLK